MKGAPATALKLTTVADNGAGLMIRLALPALAPEPVVPAPPTVPLYKARMVWLPAFSVEIVMVAWPLAFNAQRGADQGGGCCRPRKQPCQP